MIARISLIVGSATIALGLAGAPAFAQTTVPADPAAPAVPLDPATPPPGNAAPDSGPPPADTPAAQSPSEMPVDEGTANDLSPGGPANATTEGAGATGGAAATTPATPPAAAGASPSEATGAQAQAAAEPGAIGALDPYVEDVQVVGPWSEGSQAGIWRTVMVRETDDPDAYRFFIQALTDADGTLTVRDTVEITEIAEIDGGVVGYRADDGGEGAEGLTLFFDIVPSDGEIAETYELHFFGAGQPYQFGPASN